MNRWIIGLLLLLAGVVGLLNGFGFIEMDLGSFLSTFWPVLIIIWGLKVIISSRGYISGGIIALIGLAFLGNNLNLYVLSFSTFWTLFWPAIIILIGFRIILGRKDGGSQIAVMSVVEKKAQPWKLESGCYQAILGGVALDLRTAEFTERVISLDLTAIMGGIDITVPEDVAISCQGTAFLGGLDLLGKGSGGLVSDIRTQIGDVDTAEKVLKLNCNIIMGGIDIKS